MSDSSMRKIMKTINEAFDLNTDMPRYRTDVDSELYSDENMEILRKQAEDAKESLEVRKILQAAGINQSQITTIQTALKAANYKIVRIK